MPTRSEVQAVIAAAVDVQHRCTDLLNLLRRYVESGRNFEDAEGLLALTNAASAAMGELETASDELRWEIQCEADAEEAREAAIESGRYHGAA